MFAISVKSLVQDGIPLRSEGVIIVSERQHRKETEPFVQLPYWNQDAEKLVMMESVLKTVRAAGEGESVEDSPAYKHRMETLAKQVHTG